MKRALLSLFLLIISIFSHAINRTWNGGPTGNWSVPTNWLPNGTPTASDDLTINVNSTITIDVVPALSSLLITGNASVTFTVTNATTLPVSRIITPTSTSPSTKGFQLDLGSILTMETNIQNTGSGNISLRFGAGVFGLINGTLIFNGTLSGTGNPLTTIDLNATSNVQINGTLQFYDASANISGGNTANLFFNSGSVMEILKNGGSFPNATWSSSSLAKVNNLGGSNGPVFNGTSYGNLEWFCASQTFDAFLTTSVSFNNVDFISTNSTPFSITTGGSGGAHIMTINGNLTIRSGAYVNLVGNSSPAGSSGKILLKGNLDIEVGGTLITNGVAGTVSQLELNGSLNQDITVNGIFSGVRMEFIMNGASATLLTPLTLPGNNNATNANLQMVSGKVITTSANILTLSNDATASGGSNSSFVSGPMRKRGNDDFVFPVGVGSIYAPIGITNVSGEQTFDEFTAEYIRSNPQSTYGPNVVGSMNHVSYVEYWTLAQHNGNSVKRVSLNVHLLSFCKDLDNTYVGRWYSALSRWDPEGGSYVVGPTFGPYETGTITSTNNISNFTVDTAFTLITDLPFAANPLPITLISFDATKLNNTQSFINWELAACCSADAKFEMQRAGANKSFATIATVNGSTTDKSYNYIDHGLKNGVNYYRLKMIDVDGTTNYSRTVAVMNGVNGLLLTSLVPTVVTNTTTLTIASSSHQKLDILITDINGRLVYKQNYSVLAGNTSVEIPADKFSPGTYQLIGITAEGKTNMIRFLKQ